MAEEIEDPELILTIGPILKNYMASGKNQFLEICDVNGNNFVKMLFNCINIFWSSRDEDYDKKYGTIVFVLIGSVFSNFSSPVLDNYLSECIVFCVQKMKENNHSVTMKNVFYHNICLAMHYDTIKTIDILKTNGV